MLKEQAGPHQANTKYLEHPYCERVREVYQTIHAAGLYQFTYSWVDTLWKDIHSIVEELDRVPEPTFQELIEVIQKLSEARDELRLARFLFDLEEINPVHRLVMRNRAVLRSKNALQNVLQVWPAKGGVP